MSDTDTATTARTLRIISVQPDGSLAVQGWGMTPDQADEALKSFADMNHTAWSEDDPGQVASDSGPYPYDQHPPAMRQTVPVANGKPGLSQCEYKTPKGRRCKLAPNHEGDHRMVLRNAIATPKTLAELRKENTEKFGAFRLEAEEVPDVADLGREYNRKIERDDDQQRADEDALAAYEAWVAAGKPKEFDNLGTFTPVADGGKGKPVRRYIFPPEAFDTVITYLRRATQKGGPVHGKRLEYRRKTHESGNAMLYYRIVDAKSPAAATAPAPETAPEPAPEPAPETVNPADLADQENPETVTEPAPEPAGTASRKQIRTKRETAQRR
jgi:hypothetical protein